MKAAIISLGSVSSQWTHEALRKYFDVADHLDLRSIEVDLGSKKAEVYYEGKPIKEYDCVYLKGSFKYMQLLQSIATVLADNVYMPITPNAFSVGHDKLLTHLALQQHQIPMPETYVSSSSEGAKQILEKVDYPIVMKFPHGTQGKGVMFADSFSSASSMLDALMVLRQPVIIQEYVETGGKDIRAIVIGGEVVAAMQRQATEDEKRANIHAGGSGKPIKIDKGMQELAIKVARVVHAEVCAIDILPSKNGPLVIEVNLSPGLQGITNATGIPVAEKLAKFLYEETMRFKQESVSSRTQWMMSELGMPRLLASKSIISTVEREDDRIVLPEIVSKIADFKDGDEVVITSDKSSVLIQKDMPLSEGKKKKKVA
ncbi:RimK family alpha-L-glutamate ligase [Candidatus Woesearchaeota archaeon]|nr:RimK family alpha-L-glutamate ligase [Candidatus Woesearchaeota archaeon]